MSRGRVILVAVLALQFVLVVCLMKAPRLIWSSTREGVDDLASLDEAAPSVNRGSWLWRKFMISTTVPNCTDANGRVVTEIVKGSSIKCGDRSSLLRVKWIEQKREPKRDVTSPFATAEVASGPVLRKVNATTIFRNSHGGYAGSRERRTRLRGAGANARNESRAVEDLRQRRFQVGRDLPTTRDPATASDPEAARETKSASWRLRRDFADNVRSSLDRDSLRFHGRVVGYGDQKQRSSSGDLQARGEQNASAPIAPGVRIRPNVSDSIAPVAANVSDSVAPVARFRPSALVFDDEEPDEEEPEEADPDTAIARSEVSFGGRRGPLPSFNATRSNTGVEISPRNASFEVSLRNMSVESSPRNSSLEISPRNSSLEISPRNSSLEISPRNSSLEISPRNSSLEISPRNSSLEISPRNSSLEISPRNSSLEISPRNSSLEISPRNSSLEISPRNSSLEISPRNSSLEISPRNSSLEISPRNSSLEISPRNSSLEISPRNSSLEISPRNSSLEISPRNSSLEISPRNSSLEISPRNSSLEISPRNSSLEISPRNSSLEISPRNSSLEISPRNSSLEISPRNSSLEISPRNSSLEISPRNSSLEISPRNSSLEISPYGSTRKASSEVSHYGAARNTSLNQTSESLKRNSTSLEELAQVASPPSAPSAAQNVTLRNATDAIVSSNATCSQGLIYVYKLPKKFNTELLENCSQLLAWGDRCQELSNSGLGPALSSSPIRELGNASSGPWYGTDQFNGEVIFHNRILAHPCRTHDSELAKAFYIPYYGGLDVARFLFNITGKKFTSLDRDKLGKELVACLSRSPYWKRHQGLDHFLFLGRITWDFRREGSHGWGSGLFHMPEMANVTKLALERSPWDDSEMAIPYPTSFHPRNDSEVVQWQNELRMTRRGLLFSFAGAKRMEFPNDFRVALFEQCEKAESCEVLDCSQRKCEDDALATTRLFTRSTFCLQPRGDSFTRRSIFDTLISGCIPVFFWTKSAYLQYNWHLPSDYRSYSVYIPKQDIRGGVQIEAVLSKIPPAKVRQMQEKVLEMIPRLVYAQGLVKFRDAFDTTIDQVMANFELRLHQNASRVITQAVPAPAVNPKPAVVARA